MKRFVLPLLFPCSLALADSAPELWQQIGFTATEVLIYTDQLQKLDATECNQSPVSAHNTAAKREQLLEAVPPIDREQLAKLLNSPMVQGLLEENSLGINSLLSEQQLTHGSPAKDKQALCLELALGFAENQRQAQDELNQLIDRYRQSRP